MTALTAREPLRGVIPPIITPLTPSGHVDVASLERLVNFEVDAGVHAIFVLGTVGEGPYLTEDQQRITLETVTATVATRIPVLAGVSDIGTRRALHNAAIAQEYPIDALVSTSAFYGTVGSNEIDHHFRAIAASTNLPLYAYDIPVSLSSWRNQPHSVAHSDEAGQVLRRSRSVHWIVRLAPT